ncbi:hypothetical protein LTR17_018256 [Elasticomyces elasticus]|nr:hypothetical protein LTR17_018256 [Elasticomyces elasticus]
MATPSTRVPPTITSLPQEMKDLIADECELDDLPTLRVIDRAFDTSGKESLGKRYMRTRTHIYTLHGLTELEKITADPDLAKHIQKIVLVSQKYVEPGKDDSDEDDSDEDKSDTDKCALCDQGDSDEDEAEDSNLAAWRSFIDFELPGAKGGLLLQAIFRNLNRARVLHPTSAGNVIFAVSHSPDETVHQWGHRRYLERINATGIYTEDLMVFGYNYPQEVLMALLKASTKEQSPIQELDARYHATTAYDEAMGGLGFCFDCDPGTRLAAPNLESLSIASTGQQFVSDSTTLGKMAEALKHSKIKSLELGPWWTTSKALLQLLAVQRRTVRNLKLYRVGLSGNEESATKSWRNVLRLLASKFELEKVEMFQIWTGKEYRHDLGGPEWDAFELWTKQFVENRTADGPFVRRGTAAVKGGLEEFACDGVDLEEYLWDEGDWASDDWRWAHPGS